MCSVKAVKPTQALTTSALNKPAIPYSFSFAAIALSETSASYDTVFSLDNMVDRTTILSSMERLRVFTTPIAARDRLGVECARWLAQRSRSKDGAATQDDERSDRINGGF